MYDTVEHAPEQPELLLEFIVTVEMLRVLFANLCFRALENEGMCGFRGFSVVAGVYLCDTIIADMAVNATLVGGISNCVGEAFVSLVTLVVCVVVESKSSNQKTLW
jgi:hypothetical protein